MIKSGGLVINHNFLKEKIVFTVLTTLEVNYYLFRLDVTFEEIWGRISFAVYVQLS